MFNFNKFKLDGKIVYLINDISKKLLRKVKEEVSTTVKLKTANKHLITKQLKNLLEDSTPKYLIRIDIKSFSESIPQNKILKKIEQTSLSQFSKKTITQLINDFKKYSGCEIGIPRGICVTSYLNELYIKDLDFIMKSKKEVIAYLRYVDDIIIAINPNKAKKDINFYLDEIRSYLLKQKQLKLNEKKTQLFKLNIHNVPLRKYKLEFLGYKYIFKSINNTETKIYLTDKRVKKILNRIDIAFKEYYIQSKYNEKQARKLLVNRIRFLTENRKFLHKNKGHKINVGIYFSNPLLNETCLYKLDEYLIKKINSLICYEKLLKENGGHIDLLKLKNRLYKFSFVEGFKKKKFFKISEQKAKTLFQ